MDTKGADAGLLQSRYRLTKQRAAILRALEDGTHLTAETIHGRVRERLPGVSLGTIYRTLEILRGIGLVQAFSFHGGAARYEATIDKHHHLFCVSCREVRNVQDEGVAQVAREIARSQGYSDVDAALTISGRCSSCATENASALS